MADKRPVWTSPHEDGWANKREGSNKASKIFGTKAEAQQAGRETAKNSGVEHIIQKQDGTIGEKNSYGNDPHPPKG